MLHTLVDQVYLINLSTREDRLKRVSKSAKKIGLYFKRINAIDAKLIEVPEWIKNNTQTRFTPGAYALNLTTANIIEDAISSGYKNILILEDDIDFLHHAFDVSKRAISELPDNWDLLYLAQQNQVTPFPYSEHLRQACMTYLGAAYIVRDTVFEKYLSFLKSSDRPLDNWLVENVQHFGHSYCTYPAVAYPVDDVSNISGKVEKWKLKPDFSVVQE